MPNKSLSRSSLLSFQKYSSLLVGNDSYFPFDSSYELLQTYTVTGSAADVQMTNVDSFANDYDNLQILFSTRSSRSDNSADSLIMRLGTGGTLATTGYSVHYLRVGSGSSNFGASGTGATAPYITINLNAAAGLYTAGGYTTGIIDLAWPFWTSRYKTIMSMSGQTAPDSSLYLGSGALYTTAAISDIWFSHEVGSPDVESRFSLYGWRNS